MGKPIPDGYESHRESFSVLDDNRKLMGVQNALWLKGGWQVWESTRNTRDPFQKNFYIIYIRKEERKVFS